MRSIRSWVVEQLLFRQGNNIKFRNAEVLAEFMKEKQIENDIPYVLPKNIERKFNITKRNYNGMDCYIFNDENRHLNKKILYLHGGAYVIQPLVYHWRFLAKVAALTKATIYVPIYPKAPNSQYQESFEKVLPLYKEILGTTDSKDVVLMGDSAGGGFALALAQLLLTIKLPQPEHIILISPWLDITMSNPEAYTLESKDPMLGVYGLIQMGKAYAGDIDPNEYWLSPINGPLSGLGEISLFVGTHEILLPDARKFRDNATLQGVIINYYEYAKMNHDFPLYPIPEAKKAIKKIINIINKFED
ncbi:alpha/beta hydrolase [Priestia filamentosa]|uniref:alpha/beta hydrolase fold domain-containing protein n=1 Tax=Priestia filamentosa TaxID=1402861 RepID=UPI00397CDA48